jgi:hypothetical protein
LINLARRKVFSVDDLIKDIRNALKKNTILGEDKPSPSQPPEDEIPF